MHKNWIKFEIFCSRRFRDHEDYLTKRPRIIQTKQIEHSRKVHLTTNKKDYPTLNYFKILDSKLKNKKSWMHYIPQDYIFSLLQPVNPRLQILITPQNLSINL